MEFLLVEMWKVRSGVGFGGRMELLFIEMWEIIEVVYGNMVSLKCLLDI